MPSCLLATKKELGCHLWCIKMDQHILWDNLYARKFRHKDLTFFTHGSISAIIILDIVAWCAMGGFGCFEGVVRVTFKNNFGRMENLCV